MILVPEAINPGGAISYAMQNRTPTKQDPVILVSTLRELLAMPDKIVHPPSSNPVYLVILVHDTTLETLGGRVGGKSYVRARRNWWKKNPKCLRQWAGSGHARKHSDP